MRVAFSLLNKILEEFTTKTNRSVWESKAEESRQKGAPALLDYLVLAEYIIKYQDPKQADTIMKVQQELDETKIILVSRFSPSNVLSLTSLLCLQHQTIESVLQRGEKLDSLVSWRV